MITHCKKNTYTNLDNTMCIGGTAALRMAERLAKKTFEAMRELDLRVVKVSVPKRSV